MIKSLIALLTTFLFMFIIDTIKKVPKKYESLFNEALITGNLETAMKG